MKRKSFFNKELLFKQLVAASDSYKINPNHENYKKFAYWGIRYLPYYETDNVEEKFAYINIIEDYLKNITYGEFVQMFPIEKTYDGARWEMKDYYSTMEYLDGKFVDDYIDDPLELIFEYHNWYIIEFGVEFMTVTSDMYRMQTGIGITEAFMFPDNYLKNSKGDLIGITSDGKTHVVSNPRKTKLTVIK